MSSGEQWLIQTANNILNQMMMGTYFDICEFRKAAKLLGTNPTGEAFATLEKLHCVSWQHMPDDLRAAIPDLINEALAARTYRFELSLARRAAVVADVDPVRVNQGALMRLLNGMKS